MEILVFKHIQNRFYFSKTKDFLDQRLISEHMQAPVSRCTFPEKIQTKRDEKGRVDTLLKKTLQFLDLSLYPWKFQRKHNFAFGYSAKLCGVAPLGNSKEKNLDQ